MDEVFNDPTPSSATTQQQIGGFALGSPCETSTPIEATFFASSDGRGGFGFGGKRKKPLTPSGLLYGRSRLGAQGVSPVQNDNDGSTISDVSAASSLHVDAGASAEAMKITDDEFEREEKAKEIREIKRLLQLKKEKAAMIAQKRFYIDSLERTVTDLERRAEELALELASANERYTSMEKTYLYKRLLFEEKCAKIQNMRKTLKRSARKDEKMKRAVEAKEKEFQLFMEDYMQRKNAATSAIDSINKQLESARETARRSTMVLETKVRKGELEVSSMKKKLELLKTENTELKKICEDLFAHKQETVVSC